MCVVEMNQALGGEELADFAAGHLQRRRTLADEKLAAERVGLALLIRNPDAQHLAYAFDLHRDREISRAGCRLHLGFEPIVVAAICS